MKRKEAEENWNKDELAVPIPIQIFLWRQSSPFIRPKLGKLHEATCLEIKEASKSLEKVLVQNILFGLSPSLTDAIRSVPRWRFVQAAFPHVMHCTATLLYNRRDSTITNLGAAETKLLYTLHWILLDAAEECADADGDKSGNRKSPFYYLFSVTSIQVFIYLFAPLLHTLKESDFQNFRLENGLKIWNALWEFRHPDVPVFTTPVKPKRAFLRGRRVRRSNTQFGDVFLGSRKPVSPEDDSVFYLGAFDGSSGRVCGSKQSVSSSHDPLSSISSQDSRNIDAAKMDEEMRLIGGPREASFPETIPEETSSTEEEHVVIFRLGSYPDSDGLRESQVYKAEHPSSLLRPPTVEVSDVTGHTSTQIQSPSHPPSISGSTPTDSQSAKHFGTSSPYKAGSLSSAGGTSNLVDPTLATIMDIAVIRCLFVHQWTEEGVFWALTFVYRRMQEIGHEVSLKEAPRRRSNSLPVPKIEISLHGDTAAPDAKAKETELSEHSSSEHNYITELTFGSEERRERDRLVGGSTRKKKKISELRAFVETKLRSRSEKALEKIGTDESRRSSISEEQVADIGDNIWRVHRPHSALEKLEQPSVSSGPLSPFPLSQGLIKGKSMPSLRFVGSNQEVLPETKVELSIANQKQETKEVKSTLITVPVPPKVKRPIITVTQHTPSPNEYGWRDQVGLSSVLASCAGHIPIMLSQTGSIDSHHYHYFHKPHIPLPHYPQPQSSASQEIQHQQPPTSKPPLARSHTDSDIQYPCQESGEVHGTSHFVTREGHINMKVLMKAAQSIVYRDTHICSIRVCELLLHLLDFLLDMGILKMNVKLNKMGIKHQDSESSENEEKVTDKFDPSIKESDPVEAYINTTMKIITHLGCPHGCGDGHRGPPADFLRHSAQALLSRLYRCDQEGFRKHLRSFVAHRPLREVLDFFHSFLGFCVDPTSLLSPMNTKRPGTGRTLDSQQGGYATNFGASLGGAGSRGIEGQVIASVFKGLVTRFLSSHSFLKGQDNMAVYSDIRQLMCYIKETHGGVFRRVLLSGLIDSADRPHKKTRTTQTTRVVRRVTVGEEGLRDSPAPDEFESKSKKSLFRKKGTSTSITSTLKRGTSMSSVYDDVEESSHGQSPVSTIRRRHQPLYSSRHSESDRLMPSTVSRRKRINKLVNWLKKTRGGSPGMEITGLGSVFYAARQAPHDPHGRKLSSLGSASRPRYVTKPGAGPISQKLLQARKKVEDHFGKIGFGKNKRRDSDSDDSPDLSRRNSEDLEGSIREASVVLLRERKIVNIDMIKAGMLRFTFLLDTCQPGSVPDAQLAGAIIDLPGAPVVARAALLLEMAHFVHKCNRGAWPSWMKSSLPFYRPPSGPLSRGASAGVRRVSALQRAAGKMFYSWAEAIGTRLEEIFDEVGPNKEDIVLPVEDSEVKIALRTRDEEEDFLDELNVNPGGGDCPMALRMIAVQLLLEITAFLRETYPILPKSGRMSVRERPGGWHGTTLGVSIRDNHTRRWSTTLSSMGPTHASAQSLHSVVEGQVGTGERKISFALHEADNESVASSNTTLTSMQIYEEDRRRFTQTNRGHFRKKSGGSFKRRSYKLKRQQKEVDSDSIKRADSIRSRRKVSAVSERSDTSDHLDHDVSGEESPGVMSNEDLAESPADVEAGEDSFISQFPWLRIVVKIAVSFNTSCTHQNYCHPFCYKRQMRACKRITHAVRKVYGEEFEEDEIASPQIVDPSSLKKNGKKQIRKTSEPTHGSPIKRKDSIPRKEKMEKGVDISTVLSRLGQQGSIMHLCKETLEGDPRKNGSSKIESKTRVKKKEDPHPILKFLKTQVVNGLFAVPFSMIIKSIAVIPEDLIVQVLPMIWEMLLQHDNEVSSTAAVIFILSGVRTPALANNIINGQLTHSDPSVRLNAILRFQVIWRSRYQAWARMEEGAHVTFKVPPHGIEFTLPSPKVGVESIPVVEPPWMPQVKLSVEEVTLDQSQHTRSFITANRTRRKIHAEMVKTALEAEEAKRRAERENFLLSAVPVTIQAAYEPSLHHVVSEEHEEGEENEVDNTGRPISAHHVCVAQQLFPSCLCSSVLTIIHLLDDPAVTPDGVAVYQTAEQVIWSCLVEDSALFLRFFLEKLTREKQDIMARLLRRLVRFIPRLPSQAAFALFNYLVGYVMFYTRSPQEGAQEHTAAALSILWMVVPSVHGIHFKDLKQIFRKEQCDAALLLTANIPSAKKIIVHGPGGADTGGIPSQFPIQEDTQFGQIHVEAIDFFGISEEESKYHFLVDYKTNQIHNMHSYVRDFYFFKRSQYPQLMLVRMEPEAAFEALQKQAFMQKFLEIGKVLLAFSVLKRPDQRVFFLHEELTKLPSFPRKALEADFNLYKGGSMDKEIRGLDQAHKYMWVLLIARMFEGMASNLIYTTDLRIFISVINGALILHCEDSSMLRLCMATYINAATQFKNLFATNGYMLIMPTILRVYSNYQSNKMVCKIIEMVVKQLYILHRKPFVLQMLGSVAPLLDTDDNAIYGDANKIRGSRLFDLLHSLDRHHEDHIHILDLVTCEKPLKALDFCYHDESDNLSLLEVIDMCVTVVSYAADSRRGHQMLAILEAILAKTLHQFQRSSRRDFRQEKETIHHVAVAIKTLIINSEPLAKNYNGPQLSGMGGGEVKGSNRVQYTKASRNLNPAIEPDDDSHSKYVSDPKRPTLLYQSEIEDPELLRQEFRQPRAMFLNIVAEFFNICTPRLTEINRKLGMETKQSDLLDTKCHLRLAEIAHSLLKMAPYDPLTMGCQGLQRYINEILPSPDWSHEDLRPALVNILRRLEKMFNKLAKKTAVRRITDWGAASSLLRGVYTTLSKHPYIAHLPHLKMLVQVCQSLVLGERHFEPDIVSISVTSCNNSPPQDFCSVVVRIIAMQLLALGVTYSLEQICGGSSLFPNSEKSESLIVHLLLPMCLRIGCSSKDSPRMRLTDISFSVTVVLHTMNPPLVKMTPAHPNPPAKSSQQPKSAQPVRSGQGSDPRSQSWSHYHLDPKIIPKVKPALLKIAFLGLKVMVVCFDKQLSKDWLRIVHCLRDMESRGEGGIAMWDFLDFSVSYRSPLSLLIKPFILLKLKQPSGNEAIMQYKASIKDKLCGASLPPSVCKGALLRTLGQHLKILRDDLQSDKTSEDINLRPPSLEIQSEVSQVLRRTRTSTGEKSAQSPTHVGKEGASYPPSSCNEPRLYRKTFLLRKRASSASLRIGKKGECNAETSTPGSPINTKEEGETTVGPTEGDEAEETGEEASGNKHRLQRQMAQSRKTFRFRKSRYGQAELRGSLTPSDKESMQGISHVEAEQSQVRSMVPTKSSVEDSFTRKQQASLIPEEDHGSKSPKKLHRSSSFESEVKDSIGMEVSTGYKERLATIDSSLKDWERLELQVCSSTYQSMTQQFSSRKTSKSDQSTVSDVMSHQSPSTCSQVSRQSSVSNSRQGFISHDVASFSRDQLSYESLQSSSSSLHKIQVGAAQSSYPRQSEFHYRRDSKEPDKYSFARIGHDKEVSSTIQCYERMSTEIRDDLNRPSSNAKQVKTSSEYISTQDSSEHVGKLLSSFQSTQDYPQFHDKVSNFRHSWTEGEGTSQNQTYSREKAEISSKNSKCPSRKTGVAGPKALPSTRISQTDQHRTRSHYKQEQSQSSFYGAFAPTSATMASATSTTSKKSYDVEKGREVSKKKSRGKDDTEPLTREELQTPIIISGTSLPEGTKRFVVDKFTVTFTEKDGEEDTLI